MGSDPNALHSPHMGAKKGSADRLVGRTLGGCGPVLLQSVLEVLPLRSKTMERVEHSKLFPLPTSRDTLLGVHPDLTDDEMSWLLCVNLSLNSVWGCSLVTAL